VTAPVAAVVVLGRDTVNPLRAIKVLALTRYGRMGASSRVRMLQYLPWLQQAGLDVTVQSLLSDALLTDRYRQGGYGLGALLAAYYHRVRILMQRRKFDVLWVEKEALPWMPLWLERGLFQGIPYVLDYDDAVFHQYDMQPNPWLRRLYGRRLDGLMAGASLVVGGNNYLAQRARDAGAPCVEQVPTVVDISRYEPKLIAPGDHIVASDGSGEVPRIVWIGSPATVHYLELLREPLQNLATTARFKLRVIGGGRIDLPGVDVESVAWSEATEAQSIRACDVGVMPLLDSPWERGKCGYKLIQYMASGLPVVASHVGVNPEIVMHGKSGFLASTPSEWGAGLDRLLNDASLRVQMGQVGRQQVERAYCIQHTGPRMAELLRAAARGG
jgi:glycosyltransferase involved in cell wall biosynthesis